MSTIISVLTVGDPHDGKVSFAPGTQETLRAIGWTDKNWLREALKACPQVPVIDFTQEDAVA